LATTIIVFALAGVLVLLARGARSERDRVIAQLFQWSALLMTLGMLAEPLEGGIKKDPQTLGFLLLMAGMATAALASLMIVADVFRSGRRTLAPIALIGQNALFAYVIIMLGFQHILWLTGLGDSFTSTWQQATARSVVLTTLAGLIVWAATRKRLLWKT
jgi:predicted acyltransferase